MPTPELRLTRHKPSELARTILIAKDIKVRARCQTALTTRAPSPWPAGRGLWPSWKCILQRKQVVSQWDYILKIAVTLGVPAAVIECTKSHNSSHGHIRSSIFWCVCESNHNTVIWKYEQFTVICDVICCDDHGSYVGVILMAQQAQPLWFGFCV